MGWIEDRNKEQREMIHAMNPQTGDFVNLLTWYGDVWAEVLNVFPDGASMVIAEHRDGNRSKTDYIFYYMVRTVIKRDALTMNTARIIYTKDHKYTDAFSKHPGRPLEEFFGGFRASMRYRILNTKGAPVAEAKRIDTVKYVWSMLKDRELLTLRDSKTRMSMVWSDR